MTRRVSVRGAIMIGGQRIQVGLPHAGKLTEVTVESDTYQITVEPGITVTAPRTTSGARLTARELETARLAAEGLTDRQIATRLSISERTVHAHLRSAYAKAETERGSA